MYKINADPRKVLSWEHEETTSELEEIARKGELNKLPPALVFKLPKKYEILGDYVLFNGHHRREAARRVNSELPILVLECAGDFRLIEEYNEPWWYSKTNEEFETIIKTIINSALSYIADKIRLGGAEEFRSDY